jgi:D-threo-aldose 1-dehydrogenase
MKKRVLGRTGLEISEIAIGGGRVGGILIFPDESVRAAALERAWNAGINWVDTAPSYGEGESESTLGRLGQRFRISTKVQVRQADAKDIPGVIERSLTKSLERLRRNRVDVLQLHSHLGTSERSLAVENVLKKGGVADTLERLKAQGLIGAAGMTAAGDTAACIEVIRSGRFDTAQVYCNLLNPSATWKKVPAGWSAQDFSGIADACREQGMGTLNIRVFAGGSLPTPARHGREFVMASGSDLDSEERRASALRKALGDAYGTPAQMALRFCLGQEFSTSVVGLADPAHLEEAIAAAEAGPLPAEALAKLQPLWESDFRV